MPEAPLRRAVHARMKGRGRERGKSRRVYGVERGEPVREGRERATKRRGRTRWYERERFLSWRTRGCMWARARWEGVQGENVPLVGSVRKRGQHREGPSRAGPCCTMNI